MKKSMLIIGLISMAVVSQAAAFKWTVNGGKTKFDNANTGGILATLVYLGDTGSFEAYTIVNNLVKDLSVGESTSSASAATALTGNLVKKTFSANNGTPISSSVSDVMTPGASTFGLFLTYIDANNKTWYNVSSDIFTIPEDTPDSEQNLEKAFAFNWGLNEGTTLASGSGWTAVPEPATGALALAGLALLFRRKRA